MIRTAFSINKNRFGCDGCKTTFEANNPCFKIIIGETILFLCDDCGNLLSSEMTDDFESYIRFGRTSSLGGDVNVRRDN